MEEAIKEFEARWSGDYNADMDMAEEVARAHGVSPEELVHQYLSQ